MPRAQVEKVSGPSVELAIERAAARLPKRADGTPHEFFGLVTPTAMATITLGSDASIYMRIVSEGVVVSFIIFLLQLPATIVNMSPKVDWDAEYSGFYNNGWVTGTDPKTSKWTANGSWPGCNGLGEGAPLSWGRAGGNGELATATGLSWWSVWCDVSAMVVLVAWVTRLQREMLKDGMRIEQHVQELRASAIARRSSATQQIEVEATGSHMAAPTSTAAASNAVQERTTTSNGSTETAQVLNHAANVVEQAAVQTALAIGHGAARLAPYFGVREGGLLEVLQPPPLADWWKLPEHAPLRLDMFAAACTLVVWGWQEAAKEAREESGREEAGDECSEVPPQTLRKLARAAGEEPLVVTQARDVRELTLAWRQLENVSRVSERAQEPNSPAVVEAERRVGELQQKSKRLPIAFVTFRSSAAALAALAAFAESDEGGGGTYPHCHVGRSPRPTEVVWEHLHVKTNHSRWILHLYDMGVLVLFSPLIGLWWVGVRSVPATPRHAMWPSFCSKAGTTPAADG